VKDSERRPPGNHDQHSDSDSDNDDDHLSPALDQNHAKNHDDDVVPESLPEMNLGEAADPTTELDSNAPTVIDPRFSDEVVRLNLNAFVIDESDLESDEELTWTANMHEDISFPDNDPSDVAELEMRERHAENSHNDADITMMPHSDIDITDVPVFRFGQHAGVNFRTMADEETSLPTKFLTASVTPFTQSSMINDSDETVTSLQSGRFCPRPALNQQVNS